MHLYIKIVLSLLLFLLYFNLAIRYGLTGPTLDALQQYLGVSITEMTSSISVMSLGICIGAISSGYVNIVSNEATICLFVLATAILEAFFTFIRKSLLFIGSNLLIGITSGAAMTLSEAKILEIWGEKCGPWMQTMQLFRAIGFTVAPLLAQSFLPTSASTNETVVFSNSTNDPLITLHGNIHTPFILVGLVLTLCALFLATFDCCVWLKRTPNNVSEEQKEAIQKTMLKSIVTNQRHACLDFSIKTLSAIFYLFYYEELVGLFLPLFGLKINLTQDQSQNIALWFYACNLGGKIVGIALAIVLPPIAMLYASIVTIISSLMVVILYAQKDYFLLLMGVCLLGFGMSCVIGSLYTLLKINIFMNDRDCGLLNMAGTFGSVIMPLVIGHFIDNFPMVVPYAWFVCTLFCLALLLVVHRLLIRKKQHTVNTSVKQHTMEMKEKPTNIESDK